ncbi:hypothetical protein MMC11_001619 [Xylographa trunciseda]|nr:hypothetical protein [Xylographa trunciseda]
MYGGKLDPQELVNRQALSSACNLGSIWIAKYLLDHGMDVNGDEVTLDRWERPLGIAAAADQLEVSRLLISYGADPDGKVGWGYTPLIAASRNKSTKVLRFLLETQLRHIDFDYVAASGKCIAASGKYIRRNSLMFACYDDYLEGVELLLKYGANPNVEIIPYLSSWTPLTFACAAKSDLHCSEIVRLLIFYGAKVSTESGLLFAGVSSSTLAKRRGHNRAVHLLLAAEREQKAARLAYERQ